MVLKLRRNISVIIIFNFSVIIIIIIIIIMETLLNGFLGYIYSCKSH